MYSKSIGFEKQSFTNGQIVVAEMAVNSPIIITGIQASPSLLCSRSSPMALLTYAYVPGLSADPLGDLTVVSGANINATSNPGYLFANIIKAVGGAANAEIDVTNLSIEAAAGSVVILTMGFSGAGADCEMQGAIFFIDAPA